MGETTVSCEVLPPLVRGYLNAAMGRNGSQTRQGALREPRSADFASLTLSPAEPRLPPFFGYPRA